MHPYFSTTVQPWQHFNPIDVGMYQRPYAWFDPSPYQAVGYPPMQNPAMYRNPFTGFETNPYNAGNTPYAAAIPRPVFHVPPVSFSPESGHGIPSAGFPGFNPSDYLSPENFASSFGKTARSEE